MRTIVVTGSHGVGKTVLCEALVRSLGNRIDVRMIPEVARVLIAKGITMNDGVTEFGIVNYIEHYLRLSRQTPGALIVSDRSVFDLFAYISVSRPPDVRQEFVELASEIVRQEIARVEFYAYVPIEFDLTADGVRPSDLAYQRTVDSKVRELLRSYGATSITVQGSVDERVAAITRRLGL